jgi:putative ABC transport system permease protein
MGEVIGVVEDFHVSSLHGEIPPVGLQMFSSPNWSSSMKVVARLAPDDIPAAMRHLETTLKPFARDERLTFAFIDDLFDALYAAEVHLGRIFSAFAGLAILVACLGLFGLAAFAAQARTKEIGIRKVLGASIGAIVGLLSRDFLTLVMVAFVIAAPLAYWAMSRWLEDLRLPHRTRALRVCRHGYSGAWNRLRNSFYSRLAGRHRRPGKCTSNGMNARHSMPT